MHILYLCGREASYPLNQVLIRSFRKFARVDVIAESGPRRPILLRSLQVLLSALPRLLSTHYDLVFVGFYGHLLMLPLKALTRAPILFNPFISTFETLVDDRKKFTARSLPARLAFWLDKTACRAASHILLDTQANIEFFSTTFGIERERFSCVYIGSDETLFSPQPEPESNQVIVIYHGSYLPLQGIDSVIHAAALLNADKTIRFHMLGNGLEYERIQKLVAELKVENIDFLPAVPVEKLPAAIARAEIALGGHFSSSSKASRVIAGKTFQDLAMGKATIVGDTSANHELLTHAFDAWFCPVENPRALAESIQTLAQDASLRRAIGSNARQTFLKTASIPVLTGQLQAVAQKVIKGK